METVKLKQIGIDYWSRPVYKDPQGKLWKDVNCGCGDPALHSSNNNDFEGEPDMPIQFLRDWEVILINDEFYSREFVCGNSCVTRGELESLPCPFYIEDITDQQMETIICETDAGVRQRLKIANDSDIDFDNEKHSEAWWEELEAAVLNQNVPYYEDVDLPEDSE